MINAWTFSSKLQQRLAKYLLKKTFGRFLAEDLDVNQLDVQLGRGTVNLKNVHLNLEVCVCVCVNRGSYSSYQIITTLFLVTK